MNVELFFKSCDLKICFAQLTGPLPNGKIKVFSNSRQTYEWSTKEEVDDRIEKVNSILNYLFDNKIDVDVIIFPEYSAPTEYLIELYKEFANKLDCLIIGSADNFREENKIYNKLPVLIPNNDNIYWVLKKKLSQWEGGLIDEPFEYDNPVFYWIFENKRYWLSIHICMDFLHTLDRNQDFTPEDEPALMIVPMCSPEINYFYTYADTHFLKPGGRAVILSNCVGGTFAGRSSIFAETPDGLKLNPAYYIKDKKESIVIVEINFSKFKLPKKATSNLKSCIGKLVQYNMEKYGEKYYLNEEDLELSEIKYRAVINPYLYDIFGKKIRISFIGIGQYGKLDEISLNKSSIEVYSLLGHNDLMVSQLNSSIITMLNEINNYIPSWRTPGLKNGDQNNEGSNLPHFEVTKYYKVLGTLVDEIHSQAFATHIPNENDLHDIILLGSDWDNENVSEIKRNDFLKKNWILGKTDITPGEVNVIMTIFLTSPDKTDFAWKVFNANILDFLRNNDAVTSIYEGSNHRIHIDYIIRIKTKIENLFDFISELHKLGVEKEVLFDTSTYVVVKKWSGLKLDKTLLRAGLARYDEHYRNNILFKFFDETVKDDFLKLASTTQIYIINKVREIQRIINEISTIEGISFEVENELKSFLPQIANGIYLNDIKRLTNSHNFIQSLVEDYLNSIIFSLHDKEFLDIRDSLGYKNKEKNKLTLFEKIQVTKYVFRNRKNNISGEYESNCIELEEKTVYVRNAFVHNDTARITIEMYTYSLQICCMFLKNWYNIDLKLTPLV